MEIDPGYAHIRTDINMLNYCVTQEANYLMILSALLAGFIALNSVMLVICKRKASEIPKHEKKYLYISFGIFIVNMAAVLISGFMVSEKFVSGKLIETAKSSGEGLLVAAHDMYFIIDIILIIFLVEIIAALIIKKTSVYGKLLIIVFSSVPFTIFPLFFI